MRKHLKLIISIYYFLSFTFLACQSKYSTSDFAVIIRDAKLNNFSYILPLTDKKMKRLLKTDDAALLCIALYLKDAGFYDDAKTMLKFAGMNCKEPFNTISKEKLYEASDDAERILLLQERLKLLEDDEDKQKIEKDIKELLFLQGSLKN